MASRFLSLVGPSMSKAAFGKRGGWPQAFLGAGQGGLSGCQKKREGVWGAARGLLAGGHAPGVWVCACTAVWAPRPKTQKASVVWASGAWWVLGDCHTPTRCLHAGSIQTDSSLMYEERSQCLVHRAIGRTFMKACFCVRQVGENPPGKA